MSPTRAVLLAGIMVACGGRIDEGLADAQPPDSSDASVRAPIVDARPPIEDVTPVPPAPSEAAPPPTDTPPPIAAGCPNVTPSEGAPCGGDRSYYCHYFLPGPKGEPPTCPTDYKCTYDPPNKKFIGPFFGGCWILLSDCAEAQPCPKSWDPDEACVLPCERTCHCGVDGKMKCSAIACTK